MAGPTCGGWSTAHIAHSSVEEQREVREGIPLHIDPETPLDLPRVLEIGIALAARLGEIHRRGLLHNNVRPANVPVDGQGTVRLTGGGPSMKSSGGQGAVLTAVADGALTYTAPETTGRVHRPADSRSDLYSVGVSLYQMLTDVLPFTYDYPLQRSNSDL